VQRYEFRFRPGCEDLTRLGRRKAHIHAALHDNKNINARLISESGAFLIVSRVLFHQDRA
jgi:hypothetical protein